MADVVDAFHDDEVLDPGLGEDVAVEAGKSGGAGSVVKDAVAADAFVENAEVGGLLVGQETSGEDVWPAGVGVASAMAPSVMRSPKVTMDALFSSAVTSTPLRKSQVKKVCGLSSEAAPTTLPGTR